MAKKLVTAAAFQLAIGWLNALADSNMKTMQVTLDTSHFADRLVERADAEEHFARVDDIGDNPRSDEEELEGRGSAAGEAAADEPGHGAANVVLFATSA
jgi:hypothetical protein